MNEDAVSHDAGRTAPLDLASPAAECNAHDMTAVLGNTTLAEPGRYTRTAELVRLALSKIAGGTRQARNAQTTPARLGYVYESKEATNMNSRLAPPRGLEPLFQP